MEEKKILKNDLEYIFFKIKPLINDLKDKTFFITGGTGFFGKWILSTITYLNEFHDLNIKAYVLSRDPKTFIDKHPFLNNNYLEFIEGDVNKILNFDIEFDYCIHAATEASQKLNSENPEVMLKTIIDGTFNVFDLCLKSFCSSALITSSGGVYGKMSDCKQICESDIGTLNLQHIDSTYSEGKRVQELIAKIYEEKHRMQISIARCFAFLGPYLPLNTHFAAGNFIKNAIEGEDIIINGDGSPVRTYMYAADLVIALFWILIKGESCSPYNVGGQDPVSIRDLAFQVSQFSPKNIKAKILQKEKLNLNRSYYVPSIKKLSDLIPSYSQLSLSESIKRTVNWYI